MAGFHCRGPNDARYHGPPRLEYRYKCRCCTSSVAAGRSRLEVRIRYETDGYRTPRLARHTVHNTVHNTVPHQTVSTDPYVPTIHAPVYIPTYHTMPAMPCYTVHVHVPYRAGTHAYPEYCTLTLTHGVMLVSYAWVPACTGHGSPSRPPRVPEQRSLALTLWFARGHACHCNHPPRRPRAASPRRGRYLPGEDQAKQIWYYISEPRRPL
jgi:hypothetical protein